MNILFLIFIFPVIMKSSEDSLYTHRRTRSLPIPEAQSFDSDQSALTSDHEDCIERVVPAITSDDEDRIERGAPATTSDDEDRIERGALPMPDEQTILTFEGIRLLTQRVTRQRTLPRVPTKKFCALGVGLANASLTLYIFNSMGGIRGISDWTTPLAAIAAGGGALYAYEKFQAGRHTSRALEFIQKEQEEIRKMHRLVEGLQQTNATLRQKVEGTDQYIKQILPLVQRLSGISGDNARFAAVLQFLNERVEEQGKELRTLQEQFGFTDDKKEAEAQEKSLDQADDTEESSKKKGFWRKLFTT